MRARQFLNFEFPKFLPREFGRNRVWVTGRADMRVLKPGWDGAAFDLQLVARNLVQPGHSVWDIGANMGLFSYLAAFKAGPKGQVHAVEPDPKYADMIFRSARSLGEAYAPVDILCAAVADCNGLAKLNVSEAGHARNYLDGYGLANEPASEGTKPVACFTADTMLELWTAPNVVKIDVEGAELSLLRGAKRLLSEVRPVIYIEVSDDTKEPVTWLLREAGYDIFHLKGDGSEQPVDLCSFYTIARPKD